MKPGEETSTRVEGGGRESAPSRRGLFALLGALAGAGAGLAARGRGVPGPTGAEERRGGSDRLRPPGALPEPEFLATCLRCGQCVETCPAETLVLTDLEAGLACGTPRVDSRKAGCDLCAGHETLRCIEVCPSAALQPVEQHRDVRMGLAVLDRDTCLSWQGVVCRACWHACPFPGEALVLDWRTRPTVVAESCIGCGLCDHACLTEPSSVVMLASADVRPGQATHIGQPEGQPV